MKQIIRNLNPLWFAVESWKYMQGSIPAWRIVLGMPRAYGIYAYLTLTDR